ncbi:hypothetical protein BH11BAC7_BH11BAC7_11480 [soil metagenome]
MQDILGTIKFNKTAESLFQEILKNKLKSRSKEKGMPSVEIEKKLAESKNETNQCPGFGFK